MVQPQPQPALASSLDLASIETLVSYKTASGELMSERGSLRVQGKKEQGMK